MTSTKLTTGDKEAQALNHLISAIDKNKPTEAQRAELVRYLEKTPAIAESLGSVSRALVERISETLYGGGASRIAAKVHLDNMRKELEEAGESPLEKMMIDHILLAWLRLQDVEWFYQNKTSGQYHISEAEHWEKRLSAAQRRFLRASETLVKMRRLMKEPKSPVLNMLLAQQFNQR